MELLATCAFGIEAILKREIEALGFDVLNSSNGKVYFSGDEVTMVQANISLRTAERIFIVMGRKKVMSYDELFDFIITLNAKQYLSSTGKYHVLAKSVKSQLFSPRDIQSITKKALIENLKKSYHIDTFLEKEEVYTMLVDIFKDQCELLLDTSGASLHKRGYRVDQGEAPLKETLAAALILLSFYDASRKLIDPFCGSGTIPIEAALIAKNIAPGLNRKFAFNQFYWHKKSVYTAVKSKALKAINDDVTPQIFASDISMNMIEIAEENAIEAGVDDCITFEVVDALIRPYEDDYSIIISNPPYGERIGEVEDLEGLYRELGKIFKNLPTLSKYILSAFPGVEGAFKNRADRTRVLFNGKIKARYYQYYGPKPE